MKPLLVSKNMNMSVSSNESVNGMETMKNELETNWEKEIKRGKKNVFRIRFSIFGELRDKQLNYYGLSVCTHTFVYTWAGVSVFTWHAQISTACWKWRWYVKWNIDSRYVFKQTPKVEIIKRNWWGYVSSDNTIWIPAFLSRINRWEYWTFWRNGFSDWILTEEFQKMEKKDEKVTRIFLS